MTFATLISNIYLWMGVSGTFIVLFGLLLFFLIILCKKSHAMLEFSAWRKGQPIALFFQENRYCEWKPVKPDAGIIVDKDYGAFIINEKATYIDKATKNVLIPFDSAFGASVNVRSAKLADDLQYVLKDEQQMKDFRFAIANNMIEDSETVNVLKTSIHFGAIKNMTTALLPHNINSKIEKIIASRMKGFGKVNVPQVLLLFAGIFGAILLGAFVIKLTFK